MEGPYFFKIVHSKLLQSLQTPELSGSKRYLHSFLNLKIVGNSNRCHKFQFFHKKLNFCCGNYSKEETIKGTETFRGNTVLSGLY